MLISKKGVKQCVLKVAGKKRTVAKCFYPWLERKIEAIITDVIQRTPGNKKIEGGF